ncbi:DNA helicase I [Bacillus phage BCP8-2]|uniref:DNA helicase I n=2 Tax=root TaxID=1 RepID=A0A0E3D9U7_9CAUD|nr:helicase DnaB-like [Bacillus phage BCP8-2]AHJ87243.1 DNA helicase I [Bacillus phage BCP8-2]
MESPIMTQILRKAIENPIFAKEVLAVAPLTVFEGSPAYTEIAGIVKRYYQTNNKPLTEDALLTLTEDKLDRMKKDALTQQDYFGKIHYLYEVRNSGDNDVIDEKIEEYIRQKMSIDLLTKAATNLKNKEFLEKLPDEFKKILMLNISGKRNEIINVLDDAEYKRTSLSTLFQNMIPTGFKDIDHLNGGGLAKGELGLIVAASGTGKTLILTNLATNYTKNGYNVLFVALEELENRMILKFEQSLLRQNKSTILTGSVLNQEQFDKRQAFIRQHRQHFGNLFFARYSPQAVTPAKIEQLISDLMIREGIQVDAVVVDYPELLRNPRATGNEAEDGGRLFEEMRRIAQDYNVVMWTAAQMNRTAYSALVRTAEHMEGSHRKKNAAELVLTVNQTPEEYQAGFIRLYADKVRNPPEGQYNRMLGFKVIGSAQTVRDFESEQERKEHQYVLEAADEAREAMFKSKRKDSKDNTPKIDYASEINQALHTMRG